MAKNKNDSPVEKIAYDLSQTLAGLGDGWDDAEFSEVGGLTPIYSPEFAFEEKYPPVVGRIYSLEALPTIKAKRPGEKDYTPLMLNVLLAKNTKAVTGTKGARETIDAKAGEHILVPVTGNLRTIERLLGAGLDSDNIYKVVMYVEGQVSMNDVRSDMWKWNVKISNVPEKRASDGAFALPPTSKRVAELLNGGSFKTLPNGEVYNEKTGEITTNAATG